MRESCKERWHLYFRSSPVFPLRVSSVLTLSFRAASQGWRGGVFGGEGLDQLQWQHQPTLPVCFAPKGRALPPARSCHPPGQPGVTAPCPQFRWVGARSEQRSGDGAVLPVCPALVWCVCSSWAPQPMVGTAAHGGHTTPAPPDLPAASLAGAELLSRQVSTSGLAAPLAATAGSQSC